MMHYQLSPPKKEEKKTFDEDSQPQHLTLGAFASVPKLHFGDVHLGQTKSRKLIVNSPSESACFLKVVKRPSAVFVLNCGTGSVDQELLIPSHGKIEILVTWTPKQEGACFETFQVQPSTGGARLSVQLLGKCLPPTKKVAAKRRPATAAPPSTAKTSAPLLPKANDPALTITAKPTSKKITIPHSPNFSTRFTSRTGAPGKRSETVNSVIESSQAGGDTSITSLDNTKEIPVKEKGTAECLSSSDSTNSTDCQNPLAKLQSLSLPFTPDPVPVKSRLKMARPVGDGDAGGVITNQSQVSEEDSSLTKVVNPQQTFIMEHDLNAASTIGSPSRRETYLVAPSPRSSLLSQLASNNTTSCLDDSYIGTTTTTSKDKFDLREVPDLEDFPMSARKILDELSKDATETDLNETSEPIELDSNIFGDITRSLDNELEKVHRSVDLILGQVDEIGTVQQQAAIARFSDLTELDEEALMTDLPIDLDDGDTLASKAVSGEFLCIDQMDLVPNFPPEEARSDTELVSSMKQLLKEGVTDADIISRYIDSDSTGAEIRALFTELGNKYKSCRDCYEIVKAAHLSEPFTFHRIVIQQAIKNREICVKAGADLCSFKSKTSIISNLLTAYNRPWLWSALCLVFHNDKLDADDIDIMNFIDENLFWNNESMDGYEIGDSGQPTPREFHDLLVPKFLQHYLEIVYLLDSTDVPDVFAPSYSTKTILDSFEAKYLEAGDLQEALSRIPIKLSQKVDPIHYLIQENLRGPNMLAWTNVVKLVQELIGNSPEGLKLSFDSSSVEAVKKCFGSALEEAAKLGISCELPDEEFIWFLTGVPSALNEKFLWHLVLRVRLAQCKKSSGVEGLH